jgi:hypothetical protein
MREDSGSLDVDELLRQLAALTEARGLDQRTADRVSAALGAADQAVRAVRASSAAPARQQAVDALSELGVPANPALIAEFHRARFDSELAPRALASIRRDELRAFRAKSSTRSMWVVPALTTHLLPARGYLALSSWPAWLRIHGTRSAQVDALRVLLVLLDTLAGLSAAGSDRLRAVRELRRIRLTNLLVRLGVGVPGIGPTVDQESAREALQVELDELAAKDRAERDAAALTLSTVYEVQRLFGRPIRT